MTLPRERYRSIRWAREFLCELMVPKKTKRVPLAIRQQARSVLKHFPHEYEMDKIAKCKKCSEIFEGDEQD